MTQLIPPLLIAQELEGFIINALTYVDEPSLGDQTDLIKSRAQNNVKFTAKCRARAQAHRQTSEFKHENHSNASSSAQMTINDMQL
jgi:hypothetical protein